MNKKTENTSKEKKVRQRYFVARELQFSIALLVIIALLGGIFLQSVSVALAGYLKLKTPTVGIFLAIGYIIIVTILSIVFTHRLVGPFKRLEYEMKLIKDGELSQRLYIRTKDDLHVRNFVQHVNDLIAEFEEMSKAYSKLNSLVSTTLSEIIDELSKEECDKEKLIKRLQDLQKEIHRHREKW